MNCRIYDQNILRPCGKKCRDFKQVLLEIADSDQSELLVQILDKLYFGKVGKPRQKKGVIISRNIDLFKSDDQPILLYALLEGTDNSEFIKLVEQAKDFVSGFGYNSASFGGVRLVIQTFNKCFCDQCIWFHVYRTWFLNTGYFYRVFIYDDFYIVLYQFFTRYKQGIGLVQQAIDAVTPFYKCCQMNRYRDHAVWLGDGTDPTSSTCILAPKKHHSPSLITLHWDELTLNTPWLLKNFSGTGLEVVSADGCALFIKDYPREIQLFINTSDELFFIYNTGEGEFIIIVYDVNYTVEIIEYP